MTVPINPPKYNPFIPKNLAGQRIKEKLWESPTLSLFGFCIERKELFDNRNLANVSNRRQEARILDKLYEFLDGSNNCPPIKFHFCGVGWQSMLPDPPRSREEAVKYSSSLYVQHIHSLMWLPSIQITRKQKTMYTIMQLKLHIMTWYIIIWITIFNFRISLSCNSIKYWWTSRDTLPTFS